MPRLALANTSGKRLTILGVVAVVVIAAVAVFAVLRASGNDDYFVHSQMLDVPEGPSSTSIEHIDTSLYVPNDALDHPAPAVLLPHGFGGSKLSERRDAVELVQRGFVVLTYSARGFGKSTGQIGLNDPDGEVSDARQLLDYLAAQRFVIRDGAHDPRVGVVGASYGGALALMLAGLDHRVDAIVPIMTYNDLSKALVPNYGSLSGFTPRSAADTVSAGHGVFKRTWAGQLFQAGIAASGSDDGTLPDAPEPGQDPDETSSGASPSAGTMGGGGRGQSQPPSNASPCGRFTAAVCEAYTDLATDGKASPTTSKLLRHLSPRSLAGDIAAPTLLIQGEADTLFGLDQADATARQIHAAGIPVQLAWFAGGHDGGGPGPQMRARIGDWLAMRLHGRNPPDEDPFPPFSYDVQGSFRASGAPSVRTVASNSYPGILGGGRPERHKVTLHGGSQMIVSPPGGNPAAISGIPGVGTSGRGTSALTRLFSSDLAGQAATFTSDPMDSQLLATGSSTVRIAVRAQPGSGGLRTTTSDGQLFVKLYDVGPDGSRTLPGNAVAPVRLPKMRTGKTVHVTVSLPAIVHPVAAGHRVQVAVAATDMAYANASKSTAYKVSVSGSAVRVPVVPGHAFRTAWPVWQLIGIGVLIAVAVLAALLVRLRRRRAPDVDADLAGTPLVIEGLTKAYPGGITAVDGLSLAAEHGQVLGLLGPNGAGKTTTLRMLMGLITPTKGTIRVFGHRVRPGSAVLSRIGSFVESPGFLPHLSGHDNLRLYWQSTGRPDEQAHVEQALEIAGLGEAIDRRVKTYSHGMRQRLAIAQAMLGLPELLVLDEPTNGLDPPQIHQMREVLKRYAATGRTVVVSSHLLAEVEQTATHVVVMHRGRRVAGGAVAEIVAAGGQASFVVDEPAKARSALLATSGVRSVEVDGSTVHADLDGTPRSDAVAAMVGAGVRVDTAGPRRRLEDAFLQLVSGQEG